jgi:hypothetical protein
LIDFKEYRKEFFLRDIVNTKSYLVLNLRAVCLL